MNAPAICARCHKTTYVMPLHGEKGGPLVCPICSGAWHAEQRDKRKRDRLFFGSLLGRAHAEPTELTLELLDATITLTHPDRHPPERAELAHSVTAALLALRPHTLPAPPVTPTSPSPGATATKPSPSPTVTVDRSCDVATTAKPSRPAYPCEDCRDTVPRYYCTGCRARWEELRSQERERENAARRACRARRRRRRPLVSCTTCGEKFRPTRSDAKHCGQACRQKAHRGRHRAGRERGQGSGYPSMLGDAPRRPE